MKKEAQRLDYKQSSLHCSELHPEPLEQFRSWFKEAIASNLREPNAMVLGTSDGCQPSSRTVLLKGFDQGGFVFFTNYNSRKSNEISRQPNVSLLFPWYGIERQILILGTAEKTSKGESLAYFTSRPFASKIGAWVSQQSKVINSRKILELKWQEMKNRFKDGEIPLPKDWGGFRVVAKEFEFWQGRENRLHDRFRYSPKEAEGNNHSWNIERISP